MPYVFKVSGDFDPPNGISERDRDWVDIEPVQKGSDLPTFTVGNDEMSRLHNGQKFLIRRGYKNWIDISVQSLNEELVRHAVAVALTSHLQVQTEVQPDEVVFTKSY